MLKNYDSPAVKWAVVLRILDHVNGKDWLRLVRNTKKSIIYIIDVGPARRPGTDSEVLSIRKFGHYEEWRTKRRG